VLGTLALHPLPAAARPHPTPSPSPTPVADPTVTDIARKQFVAWQAGNVNRSLYADSIQTVLTDAKIDQSSRALGTLGALTNMVYIGPLAVPSDLPNAKGYIYQMNCVGGTVYLFMVIDQQGKIDRIFFKDKLETETIQGTPPPAPPRAKVDLG
jgi:hypothetical protein